jgi:hypothetical protein
MKAVLFVLLMFCFRAYGQPDDSAAIAQLIIADYKTFNNWDYKQHQRHCLPHYQLIENGIVMSLQDEVNYFKKNAHRKIKRKDAFQISSIRILGNTGYAIYKLKSTIEEGGKRKHYQWTESAVCENTVDGWRLALIHSTAVK